MRSFGLDTKTIEVLNEIKVLSMIQLRSDKVLFVYLCAFETQPAPNLIKYVNLN